MPTHDVKDRLAAEYEPLIKKMLSKKRYVHSVNVADMCVYLAKRYGEDAGRAYTAGILHDIMKERPPEELLERAAGSGLSPDPVELAVPALRHAVAGGHYAKSELGITDGDVINSIRFHTIGRANMTLLEKIVYLGDLVSKERDFPDVEKHRDYVNKDLDFAMYQALKLAITDTLRKNGKIPAYTLQAYNCYNEFCKENKK
ncbi:MAG: bis(5'-nucleosyl)-tetraphosphatase (symmetrical) YqeK [Oscillospiraceae bacterium]|jgi:predicted HD superfamily hydrolase involved in NAD metabolism|nr:bis(5'-nucleosyl)-tetraphosphatase (symmetrical) YqeK [Oscillospiraceae bacterium]